MDLPPLHFRSSRSSTGPLDRPVPLCNQLGRPLEQRAAPLMAQSRRKTSSAAELQWDSGNGAIDGYRGKSGAGGYCNLSKWSSREIRQTRNSSAAVVCYASFTGAVKTLFAVAEPLGRLDRRRRLLHVSPRGYGPCMAEVYAAFCRVSWDMWTRAWIGWVLRGVRVRA